MKFGVVTACVAILLAQSANAWVFTWHESNGVPHVHDGGKVNKGCTTINHGKGQEFSWKRGSSSNCCISLYSSAGCPGDPQGYSCPNWSKDSSVALKSYKVTHC